MALPFSNAHPSLQDHRKTPSSSSSSSTYAWLMSYAPQFLTVPHPRKAKYRTTFISLISLVFLSIYVFIIHGSWLSPTLALRRTDSPAADQLAVALESIQNARIGEAGSESVPLDGHRHLDSSNRAGRGRHRQQYPPLKLTPEQELAAISAFIASLPQNVIPPTVSPSHPIDPQLVLDFDTRGPRAAEEVQALVKDVWSRNPVFVYSRHYSPTSRELKTMLADLRLYPSPTIVDIDTRDDVDVLKPILMRLTSPSELPLLLIGGKVVGTMDDIREMSKDGRLQSLVTQAGAVVNGAKKKKGRKH